MKTLEKKEPNTVTNLKIYVAKPTREKRAP